LLSKTDAEAVLGVILQPPTPQAPFSTTCIGEYVGLEEIDDGILNVYFGRLRLGRLLERKMKIEDAFGRLYRDQ
jgi:hypothetical protein